MVIPASFAFHLVIRSQLQSAKWEVLLYLNPNGPQSSNSSKRLQCKQITIFYISLSLPLSLNDPSTVSWLKEEKRKKFNSNEIKFTHKLLEMHKNATWNCTLLTLFFSLSLVSFSLIHWNDDSFFFLSPSFCHSFFFSFEEAHETTTNNLSTTWYLEERKEEKKTISPYGYVPCLTLPLSSHLSIDFWWKPEKASKRVLQQSATTSASFFIRQPSFDKFFSLIRSPRLFQVCNPQPANQQSCCFYVWLCSKRTTTNSNNV